jgi:alanine racemase
MKNETRRAAHREIDLSAFNSNYREIKRVAGDSGIIATIKADAYGHGSVKCAWELVKNKTDFLGVATLPEAVELRTSGIRAPIVLFSPFPRPNSKDVIDLDVIPVISTYEDAEILNETAAHADASNQQDIFIALETGMGRIGFQDNVEDLNNILSIHQLSNIHIKGVFSHFAVAEIEDETFSRLQISRFESFINKIEALGISLQFRTMANSAGIVRFPESRYELVRPGLLLYGIYPSKFVDREKLKLLPVMSIKSHLTLVRKVPAGFTVSYGSNFVTSRESLIATIPVGYADGMPRLSAGKLNVIVNDQFAPIVGNVTMDQFMVDVTDITSVHEYDEVIIMGKSKSLSITAEDIAAVTGAIPYEVLCAFGRRLSAVYVY